MKFRGVAGRVWFCARPAFLWRGEAAAERRSQMVCQRLLKIILLFTNHIR